MRFRPGQSGNRRGRPKNRPASISAHLKSLLGCDVSLVFEIAATAEHKRRSKLLSDRWLAAKMLIACLDGNVEILKLVLDRTEGPVRRFVAPIHGVELQIHYLEEGRQRALNATAKRA